MALSGLALALPSCSDLDQENPDIYSAENFWLSEANFTGNIAAQQAYFRTYMDQLTLFTAGELRTDYYWTGGGLDGSGLNNTAITNNQLAYNVTQFTDYANIYKLIDNCNIYLYYDEERGAEYLEPEEREYMLGIVYGLRAYSNFMIHKMYGTGPIRNESEIIRGERDPQQLEKPQATVEEFLQNVKDDVALSLQHFNAANGYTNSQFSANGGQCYWNKAATEMLAGEVYLWSGKVSTRGTALGSHEANPADVATAKQYFENVVNNYGYRLMADYTDAINVKGASNTERIFGSYYSLDEATTNWFNYIQCDPTVGGTLGNYWNPVEDDGTTPSHNAGRYSYCYNPDDVTKSVARTTYYLQRMSGQNRYQVRNAYYYQFDKEDNRSFIFQPLWCVNKDESKIRNIADFKPEDHVFAGCFVWKYHGELNIGTNKMDGTNFMTYYRLPLAYAYLAEIANYEGNNADVEKYINLIRERAYGGLLGDTSNAKYGEPKNTWDVNKYGYKAGSFLENEVAILQEKSKEFFQEGQRWWDLRRMTAVKGGSDADHLIFRPEGCIGYGLDVANHPEWHEVCNNGVDPESPKLVVSTDTPVLDYATKSHMVLWPLDQNLLSIETILKQTPGYECIGDQQNW